MRDTKHQEGLKALNTVYFYASNPHDHWGDYDDGYLLAIKQAQDAYAARTYFEFLRWHGAATASSKLIPGSGKYKQGYIDGLQEITEMINSGVL